METIQKYPYTPLFGDEHLRNVVTTYSYLNTVFWLVVGVAVYVA